MSPEQMQQLFEYNAWANKRSLSATEKLSSEQFLKSMGSSFSSVRDTLGHIYAGELIWFERFRGRSPGGLASPDQFQDHAALRAKLVQQDEDFLKYVGGLTQAGLDRDFEFKSKFFGVFRSPLWQTLLHVINHGTYHRGQLTTLLRQLGAESIGTDLTRFYFERAASAKVETS